MHAPNTPDDIAADTEVEAICPGCGGVALLTCSCSSVSSVAEQDERRGDTGVDAPDDGGLN